ncbi:DNA polymerase III subunit delta [Litorimonas sp. WD9-15]|uniref:DNA polymerase III subunit delta n=1 Tax=Litorimonas sp. WD9-15 TaxID=3418716 RepID=UPI003D00EE9E
MKITGARQARFLQSPPPDVIGVLLFGPDRGRVKSRAQALATVMVPDADPTFGATLITADDLTGDPAKLSDEMSAMSLLGGGRLVRLRLDHERQAAAISKLIKSFDTEPDRAEAKLIIEAGDMTTRSAIRKAVEASKHFAAIGCYAANANDLRDQIKDSLKAHSIDITPEALENWLPLLEGDHALATGEIEKMALYKGYGKSEGEVVTLTDIQAVAAGGQSASIDSIVTDALTGDVDAMDANFRRAVAGKVSPIGILFGLQRQLMRLTEASILMDAGQPKGQAMRALRPPVFAMQERVFSRQLDIWGLRMLRRSLFECQQAERAAKTAGAPVDSIVSRLLLALSGYAAKRR